MSPDRPQQLWGGFAPGNDISLAGAQAAARRRVFEVVQPNDWDDVIRAVLVKAKKGDMAAVRELGMRMLGKPLEADLLQRIEDMERRLTEHEGVEE